MAAGMGPGPTSTGGGGGGGGGAGKTGEDVSHGPGNPNRSSRAQILHSMPIRKRQAFLRKVGYKLAVDGLKGPQTRHAARAYLSGVKPHQWNTKSQWSNPNMNTHPDKKTGNGNDNKNKNNNGKGKGNKIHKIGAGATPGFKPGKYAKATTALQYNGVLAELRRQIDQQGGQSAQSIADINGWFNDAKQMAADTTGANAQANADAVAQQGQQYGDLMNSLGGASGSNALQLQQGQNQDFLAQQQLAQQGFDTGMQNYEVGAAGQALTDQHRLNDQTELDLKAKLTQLLTDRGNAAVKNRGDAQQIALQRQAQIQNMKILAQQAGIDLRAANDLHKNQQITNKSLRLQIKAYGSGGGGAKAMDHAFKHLKPGDKEHMSEYAYTNYMYHDGGNGPQAVKNPQQAWVSFARYMRAVGYNPGTSMATRKWMATVWAKYVDDYNQEHPNAHYQKNANGTPFTDRDWNSKKKGVH